jgi:hypothetical protein
MIYYDMYVAAQDQDRSLVKELTSGDFQYTFTLTASNKTGGLRINLESEIDGVATKLTDGICFSVIVCKCNQKQPQPHHPQGWPGISDVVNLDKCHIVAAHQKNGHGIRVMTELIKWYRESKTNLLTVAVPQAGRFYKKLGFIMNRSLGMLQMDVSRSVNDWQDHFMLRRSSKKPRSDANGSPPLLPKCWPFN